MCSQPSFEATGLAPWSVTTNLSYEQVEIATPVGETVIYCDPPYESTGTYQHELEHNVFYEWVKSHKYKVYVSSYEAPLYEVHGWKHRSILSATNNNKRVTEKLYCNRQERPKRQGRLI